jgi:hypothetical protein
LRNSPIPKVAKPAERIRMALKRCSGKGNMRAVTNMIMADTIAAYAEMRRGWI